MPHTDRCTVLATYIKDSVLIPVVADLGIQRVYYGEHNNIPEAVVVTVQPLRKTRQLQGVAGPGGRSLNEMRVLVTVYYSVLTNEEEARLAVDRLSEDIEFQLHKDTTMGGNIIHGFVEEWETGVSVKENTMFRVVQMTYYAQTKTNITQ